MMLTIYIIFLCFAMIIMMLNLLSVFDIHFVDTNADLDPSMDIDNDIDNDATIDMIEAHQEKNNYIYIITFILRFSFYFSLGFGVIGLINTLLHQPTKLVFMASCVVGLIAFFTAKLMAKLFSHTVQSDINERVLIGQPATVELTIYQDQIGKINIEYNDRIYTRYAKLVKEKQNMNIERDTPVTILSMNNNNEFIVDPIMTLQKNK